MNYSKIKKRAFNYIYLLQLVFCLIILFSFPEYVVSDTSDNLIRNGYKYLDTLEIGSAKKAFDKALTLIKNKSFNNVEYINAVRGKSLVTMYNGKLISSLNEFNGYLNKINKSVFHQQYNDILLDICETQVKLKQFDKAKLYLEKYQKGVSSTAINENLRYQLLYAQILIETNNFIHSIALLKSLLNNNTKSIYYYQIIEKLLYAYINQGQLSLSKELLETFKNKYKGDDLEGEIIYYKNLGKIDCIWGSVIEGISSLEKVINLLNSFPNNYKAYTYYMELGDIYKFLQQPQVAFKCYSKGFNLALMLNSDYLISSSIIKLSKHYLMLDEPYFSFRLLKSISNRVNDLSLPEVTAEYHNTLGQTHYTLEEDDDAISNLNYSYIYYKKTFNKLNLCNVSYYLGLSYKKLKLNISAIEKLTEAYLLSVETNNYDMQISSLYYLGLTFLTTNNVSEAAKKLHASFMKIEDIFSNFAIPPHEKAHYIMKYSDICKILSSLFANDNDIETAFYYLERSKTYSIAEYLAKELLLNKEIIAQNISDKDESIHSLYKKLIEYDLILLNKAININIDGINKLKNITFESYRNDLNRLFKNNYNLKIKLSPEFITSKEAVKIVPHDSVVLEYLVPPEKELNSFVFVIKSNGIRCFNIGGPLQIKNGVRNFRHYVLGILDKDISSNSINSSENYSSNSLIYTVLIKPITRYLNDVQNVYFIPDEELFYLPFEAIKTSDNKYLIEIFNTSYFMSMSQMKTILFRKSIYNEKKMDETINVFEQEPIISVPGADKDKTNEKTKKNQNIPELENIFSFNKFDVFYKLRYGLSLFNTFKELNVYSDDDFANTNDYDIINRYYLRNDVKKNNINDIYTFLKRHSDKTIKNLHINSMTYRSSSYPELACLFVNSKSSKEDDDNYLYPTKILNMNFYINTIFLSLKDIDKSSLYGEGEELKNIIRSFIDTGTENVILPLWTIDNDTSFRVVSEYYNCLNAGETTIRAMRIAKLNMIKQSKTNHPYFWSSFVSYGYGLDKDVLFELSKNISDNSVRSKSLKLNTPISLILPIHFGYSNFLINGKYNQYYLIGYPIELCFNDITINTGFRRFLSFDNYKKGFNEIPFGISYNLLNILNTDVSFGMEGGEFFNDKFNNTSFNFMPKLTLNYSFGNNSMLFWKSKEFNLQLGFGYNIINDNYKGLLIYSSLIGSF